METKSEKLCVAVVTGGKLYSWKVLYKAVPPSDLRSIAANLSWDYLPRSPYTIHVARILGDEGAWFAQWPLHPNEPGWPPPAPYGEYVEQQVSTLNGK